MQMNRVPADRNWLERWLNIYWLRPERALWRTGNTIASTGAETNQLSVHPSGDGRIFKSPLAYGDSGRGFDTQGATRGVDTGFRTVEGFLAVISREAET